MLLKSLIFHYHGLDEDEKKILEKSAEELKAHEELEWANGFIAEDYLSAFERSRDFLNKIIGHLPKAKRLSYLHSVWQDNNKKGYLVVPYQVGLSLIMYFQGSFQHDFCYYQ